MDNKLKKLLKINGVGHLIKDLEKVKPHNCNQMAGGIQFVSDNWDVEPNGAVLNDIIDYLKNKAGSENTNKYKANFLWPHEDGSIEQAGYEFANATVEEYRQEWWEELLRLKENSYE